ncbi:3-octaprenyl-4-hydroxybenzoate carboxy-lyase [Staphylothermus marinus F1]|uniref:Flavin prenyltransferase UbiX n=1 Tax=Staphylothermus marinus (strain ATCC 43588 / DSM 3639 / JCM 9404 / F1) TaxID=399550 RepID=A3DNL3_STAMF|nr:UbiX family flavin prenyltransferase [Staphylothermus marinus]ABN70223.1 3-octaprenyl-4-hydroxybenzoate carboxy-lyase [Staphylothermus marinus F1]
MNNRIIVGISGASGIRYALKLLDMCSLMKRKYSEVDVIVTDNAKLVARVEEGIDDIIDYLRKNNCVEKIYGEKDWFSPLSSSSNLAHSDMVIIPASMNTVAKLAASIQDNLLLRTAASIMRLHRKLIIVFRETPLSTMDLRNLYMLSMGGAVILPASPAFYSKPQTIDDIILFIVGKVFDSLGIPHDLYCRWMSC